MINSCNKKTGYSTLLVKKTVLSDLKLSCVIRSLFKFKKINLLFKINKNQVLQQNWLSNIKTKSTKLQIKPKKMCPEVKNLIKQNTLSYPECVASL